ncbi:MAG TPA: succinate dehydrogenase/fumarate reductase iron-sulfur subunit [Ignavibacteriaceae bacterium]|nr:succinate dehydrogenase/fumarate reductase iron-sulfur subunit [Ignavibacteriaceae bacterium]
MSKNINVHLKVWRQKNSTDEGRFVDYDAKDVSQDMSFLEMLDVVNQNLILKGEDPIAFDHDCREGICGSCGMFVNGRAHGPKKLITTCQLYMRSFEDGETIVLEPWRAKAFPVIKDLIVDRSAFDRIIAAGGFVSVNTGGTPDANANLIPKEDQEWALDAAECIGCGACVAACKNASAMLFTSAKISHLSRLPQGKIERKRRAINMIAQMEKETFGSCTNTEACSAECPKGISMDTIAQARREFFAAYLKEKK